MAYEFQVSLRAATEGQMRANIMAIGTVSLAVDGQVLVELRDFNVKRTRAQDKIFVGAASKSYKNREGETKWAPLYKVFPQEAQDSQGYKNLISKIESEYTRLGGTATQTITQNNAPAPNATPAQNSQPLAEAFPTAGATAEISPPPAAPTPPPAETPAMGAPVMDNPPASGGMPNPNPASGGGWPFS